MKHGCSMWGNSGSNPICWTHDTLTPLFRCKRYRAPHFKVFCVLLSTFLYDLSDYWRKRKSLIIKTSCLGQPKHLCPIGSITWWSGHAYNAKPLLDLNFVDLMFMFNVSCTSGQFSTQRLFLTLSVKSRCLELLHLHWILSSMSERRSFNIFIFRKCKKLLRENFGKWPVWWVKIICAAKKLAALCAGTSRKADMQQFSLNALPQIPQAHLVELGTESVNLGE